MLKQVTFSNLYSYPNTHQISFKSRTNMYAVYGGIGSGKSNLLNLIESITHSIWDKPNYNQLRNNICKYSNSEIIDICFIFVWNKKEYEYSITFNPFSETIIFQQLKYSQINKILFKFDGTSISSDFMTTYQSKMLSTFDVKSYGVQYYINNLNDTGIINEIKQLISAAKVQDYVKLDIKQLKTDHHLRSQIVELLNMFGVHVRDIEVVSTKHEYLLKIQETAGEKNSAVTNKHTSPKFKLIYDDYEINLESESIGTQKLFNLFIEILLVEHNPFFTPRIIDDIDSYLHPDIVFHVLSLYKKYCARQLIFSTKNPKILEEKLLPKESFFFLDKYPTHTSITSLASFKDLRSDQRHNWYKMYAEGKFGGYPQLEITDLHF